MSDEIELKPCPACGGYPEIGGNVDGTEVWIACGNLRKCRMGGPTRSTVEEAARAWNDLPRALVWSSEPPTVPGWYFTRRKFPGKPLRLVYVKREKRFDYQGKNPRHFMTMACKKSEEGYISSKIWVSQKGFGPGRFPNQRRQNDRPLYDERHAAPARNIPPAIRIAGRGSRGCGKGRGNQAANKRAVRHILRHSGTQKKGHEQRGFFGSWQKYCRGKT